MSTISKIDIFKNNIELYIKREDLLHPVISGNKFRKLKYNILKAKELKYTKLLTFGGAYSNHIVAVAGAGKEFGFETIGVIRGEELKDIFQFNPSLTKANGYGMSFKFINREQYQNKTAIDFLNQLEEEFGEFYLIPEGGTNALAVQGCEEILSDETEVYDFICCSVGTGGTVSGIINASQEKQKIIGFSSLKGDFLKKDISKFVTKKNWNINCDFHFGGYGKVTEELIQFINNFYCKYDIPLDPIYTGKMMFGVLDLIRQDYFPNNSKILVIHTGGLQGIEGMNMLLKSKNKTLIQI